MIFDKICMRHPMFFDLICPSTGLSTMVKYPIKKSSFKCRFDFEVGYLVKSPCKDCDQRETLPACSSNCIILDKVQSVLSTAISSSKHL